MSQELAFCLFPGPLLSSSQICGGPLVLLVSSFSFVFSNLKQKEKRKEKGRKTHERGRFFFVQENSEKGMIAILIIFHFIGTLVSSVVQTNRRKKKKHRSLRLSRIASFMNLPGYYFAFCFLFFSHFRCLNCHVNVIQSTHWVLGRWDCFGNLINVWKMEGSLYECLLYFRMVVVNIV